MDKAERWLEKTLHYRFDDASLYSRALTHRSAAGRNNERLEFLGDAVLDAILADDPVMGVLTPGSHGSTYGGNPLAAAVAREALRVLVDERLVERSDEFGDETMDRLRAIDSPYVETVRGRGLWIGIVTN